MRIGVLALQGDFREHLGVVEALGHYPVEVRTPAELEPVDALIIPGGESTTIGKLATIGGLVEPIRAAVDDGMPVLGTCAGMIFLAGQTTGPYQPQLGILDVVVERNAFGSQAHSFEFDLLVADWSEPMHAVFIRAPWIVKVGAEVDVLATIQHPQSGTERPVVVRQGHILATSFHPELTGDTRIHQLLVEMAATTTAPGNA